MTKAHALRSLLNLGSLNYQELLEITGWSDKDLRSVMNSARVNGFIQQQRHKWHLTAKGKARVTTDMKKTIQAIGYVLKEQGQEKSDSLICAMGTNPMPSGY